MPRYSVDRLLKYLVKEDKNFEAPEKVLFFSIQTFSVLRFHIFF
jgi:hypothetical protein